MQTTDRTFASVVGVLLLVGTTSAAAAGESAGGVPIERFHKVDARVYRGAQPDTDGFRYLRSIGVRTVVNLREEGDSIALREQQVAESFGMRYVHLPVKDGNFFTRSRRIPDGTVRAFFELVDTADAGPLFVHCRRGADRTGAIIGMYRIARHGWDPARAYAEARGLGMRSWYKGLKHQLTEFAGQLLQRPPVAALGSTPR